MQLHQLTIAQAADTLRRKECSAVDLTEACLARIDSLDSSLHAFLEVTRPTALQQAAVVDTARQRGDQLSPLAGVPFGIKDIIATTEGHTTAASKMLEHFRSSFDATVIARLKAAGAVIIGKTNLDEFAHGASTENSAFRPTHNPWDTERVPGGSSGGSAAAVAVGECLGSLGTDTGGSIRHPAGFCGVVGLKPSYGRVSRYGLLSMTSSTDCPGPITRTAEDAALVLQAIAGCDSHDATTVDQPVVDYAAALSQSVTGLRIGLPKEFFGAGLQPGVETAVRAALAELEKAGAELVEVSLPHAPDSIAVYYIITPSEISANLARYDGIRFGHVSSAAKTLIEAYQRNRGEGFGPEAKRRIMLGTYALSSGYYDAYYKQAQAVRTVIAREVQSVFEQVDVIATPTVPHTAFKLGEQVADPLKMYLEDIYMGVASIVGLPALSAPCGFADGLPVGLQLIGKPLAEHTILALAHQYQQLTDWHLQQPPL